MNEEAIKKWLQHRIDYWESVTEKPLAEDTADELMKKKEYEGRLCAFYQVMEFIEGQRK